MGGTRIFSLFGILVLATACSVSSEDKNTSIKYKFDEKINGLSCSTGEQVFSSKADYCAGLKDNGRNNDCAYRKRKETYLAECGQDFEPTPENSKPVPRPTATPIPDDHRPTPPPQPTPDQRPTPDPIDLYPPVVRELKSHGIEFEIFRPGGHSQYQDFHLHLRQFWNVLEQNKAEFFKRSHIIKKLTITHWAAYDSDSLEISLLPALDSQLLNRYLNLIDRQVLLNKQTGVVIESVIDVYSSRPTDLSRVENRVSYFESQQALLKSLNPLLKQIRLESYPHFYIREGKLQLAADDFKAQFAQASIPLAAMAPFAKFAAARGIELTTLEDIIKDPAPMIAVFTQFEKERASFEKLAQNKVITSIDFRGGNYVFLGSGGNLTIGLQGGTMNGDVIRALAAQLTLQNDLGVDVERSMFELDADYVECVRRLGQRASAIKARVAKIKRVRLVTYGSSFQSGVLYVSNKGTLADLDTAISAIK